MDDNPYQPPSAPPLPPAATPPDFQLRVFHPLQVLIATLFGHLLAAGYMIAFNDRMLGHRFRSSVILYASITYTLMIVKYCHLLPPAVQLWLVLGAIPTVTFCAWIPLRRLLQGSIAFESHGHALVIGLVSLIFHIVIFTFLGTPTLRN